MHIILLDFPDEGDEDFSSSRRRLRSLLSRSLSSRSALELSLDRMSLYLFLSLLEEDFALLLPPLLPTAVMVKELGMLDEEESFPNGMISMPGRRSKVIFG